MDLFILTTEQRDLIVDLINTQFGGKLSEYWTIDPVETNKVGEWVVPVDVTDRLPEFGLGGYKEALNELGIDLDLVPIKDSMEVEFKVYE